MRFSSTLNLLLAGASLLVSTVPNVKAARSGVRGLRKLDATEDAAASHHPAGAAKNLYASPSEKTNPHHGDGQDEAERRGRAFSTSGHLSFKYKGVTQYLKIKSDGWVTYTTSKDKEATRFAQYKEGGKIYYTVTSGDWDDYYLSYNNYWGYLGAFRWIDAVAWGTFDGCLTVHGTA